MTGIVAQYKQSAFKIIGVVDMIRTGDEHLFHFGFYTECGSADIVGVDRHFAISQNFEAQFFRGAVKNIAAFFPQPDFGGEKYYTHTVSTERRKVCAQLDA